MTPSEDQYRRIDIPVLTITGHYDDDQLGALTYYQRHIHLGPPDAVRQHYLVIGPYDHSGTRRPVEELGGLKFGTAAVMDMEKLHKEWYDYVLKGQAKPAFLKDRIAYFVTGSNSWRYVSSWDHFLAEPLRFYLSGHHPEGHDLFRSAWLAKMPMGEPGELQLVLNPHKMRDRALFEIDDKDYLLNQRQAYVTGEDVLLFHSEPFTADTEISGTPSLRFWISSDAPDADLRASISEVRPDGTVVFLSSCQLRLRYRDDLRRPQPLPLDRPVEITFNDFSFFSRIIAKGSRIRLALGFPVSPNWESNGHTGGRVSKEAAASARVATLRVLSGPDYPSALSLPRVRTEALSESAAAASGR
jgi:uncharacterized protein